MKVSISIVALVVSLTISAQPAKKNVAILLFDGVEVIDYAGPFEVLSYARKNGQAHFNIYFVGKNSSAIKCAASGLKLIPDFNFSNCPDPDYIVVPGGNVYDAIEDDSIISWIKIKSQKTKVTMSVCNGAYFLGKAGLLNDKEATATAYSAYSGSLAKYGRGIHIKYDKRFVWATDHVLTTSGLSSGIDGALSLIEKEISFGAAQDAALSIEYNWHSKSSFVRSKLAEMAFFNAASALKSKAYLGDILRSEGDENWWEKEIKVVEPKGMDSLVTAVQNILKKEDGWNDIRRDKGFLISHFTDKRNNKFHGSAKFKALSNDEYLVTIKVNK